MADKLSFYDVKSKSKFETDEYVLVDKSGRWFAVTKSKSGTHECWRVLGKAQAADLKKAGVKVSKRPSKK
jgi:hypothetical protein